MGKKRRSRVARGSAPTRRKCKTAEAVQSDDHSTFHPTGSEAPPNPEVDEPQVEDIVKVELEPEEGPPIDVNYQQEEELFMDFNQVEEIDIGMVEVKVLQYPEEELVLQVEDEVGPESNSTNDSAIRTNRDSQAMKDLHTTASTLKQTEHQVDTNESENFPVNVELNAEVIANQKSESDKKARNLEVNNDYCKDKAKEQGKRVPVESRGFLEPEIVELTSSQSNETNCAPTPPSISSRSSTESESNVSLMCVTLSIYEAADDNERNTAEIKDSQDPQTDKTKMTLGDSEAGKDLHKTASISKSTANPVTNDILIERAAETIAACFASKEQGTIHAAGFGQEDCPDEDVVQGNDDHAAINNYDKAKMTENVETMQSVKKMVTRSQAKEPETRCVDETAKKIRKASGSNPKGNGDHNALIDLDGEMTENGEVMQPIKKMLTRSRCQTMEQERRDGEDTAQKIQNASGSNPKSGNKLALRIPCNNPCSKHTSVDSEDTTQTMEKHNDSANKKVKLTPFPSLITKIQPELWTEVGPLASMSITNPETGKQKCQICEKEFAYKSGFCNHYKRVHLKVRFKCETCGKEFISKGSCKTHQDTAHSGVRYACQVCSKLFTTTVSLRQHQLSTDCGDKLWLGNYPSNPQVAVTQVCEDTQLMGEEENDNKTNHQSGLSANSIRKILPKSGAGVGAPVSSINPETGKHKCGTCSMEFSSKGGFKLHSENVHLKTRYKCITCGKQFAHRSNCRRHQQTSHGGLRFECQVCRKSFTEKKYVQFHQQTMDCGKKLCLGGFPPNPQKVRRNVLRTPTSVSRIEGKSRRKEEDTCPPLIRGEVRCHQKSAECEKNPSRNLTTPT